MFRCLLRMFGEGDSPDPRPARRKGLNLQDKRSADRPRNLARLLGRSRRPAARHGKPVLGQQRLALKFMQPGHSARKDMKTEAVTLAAKLNRGISYCRTFQSFA